MRTQHTPGPWWVNGTAEGEPEVMFPTVKAFVNGTRAVTVCRVGNNNQYRGNESRDWPNARLIAAAPELLDALCMVLDDPEALDGRPLTYERVRAAIAKATGEKS